MFDESRAVVFVADLFEVVDQQQWWCPGVGHRDPQQQVVEFAEIADVVGEVRQRAIAEHRRAHLLEFPLSGPADQQVPRGVPTDLLGDEVPHRHRLGDVVDALEPRDRGHGPDPRRCGAAEYAQRPRRGLHPSAERQQQRGPARSGEALDHRESAERDAQVHRTEHRPQRSAAREPVGAHRERVPEGSENPVCSSMLVTAAHQPRFGGGIDPSSQTQPSGLRRVWRESVRTRRGG